MEGIHSTRQSIPSFHFRRPIQSIPLDDLLTITANSLLESLVTTLKDHNKRFQLHIEEQRSLYYKYINTVSQIYTVKNHTSSIKRACSSTNNKSCKSPATFEVKTYYLETNTEIEKKALEIKHEAYRYFYTTVDSRIGTQTLLAIGKIKSIIFHFENSADKKNRQTLLLLAWSCIEFLWQELKNTTDYPPVETFFNQVCEVMKNIISGNTYSMDRLIQLFDTDSKSIKYLYLLFDPNINNRLNINSDKTNLFIKRYQQITHIILKSSSITTAQKHLVQSFDVGTWSKSSIAKNELNRQELYLTACDFIEKSFTKNSNNDYNDSSQKLYMIYHSQIINLMQEYLNQQNEINQGEILYVLHILLNMLATVVNFNSDCKIDCHLHSNLNEIIDKFTASLTTKPLQDIFNLLESSSLPKLELAFITDADQILDVLYTILSQQRDLHHGNVKDIFGSACISISRFMLIFMLHSENLLFDQVVKLFSLFWISFEDKYAHGTSKLHSNQTIIHDKNDDQQLLNDNSNNKAVQYIIQSFELILKQLILSDDESNEKKTLFKIFRYYHDDIFNKVNNDFQTQFCNMMNTIHWHSLSLHTNDNNDFLDTLWKSVHCLTSNNNKYKKRSISQYLKFVYTFIQQTVFFQINTNGGGNINKELKDIMNQRQLIIYIKLAFIILMYADSIWIDDDNYLQKVELLWIPISYSINNIHLSANDIRDIISSTQINFTYNWISTLDEVMDKQLNHSGTNNNDHNKTNIGNIKGSDNLLLCVKWMKDLTINGIRNDFDKTMEYGSFILPLFSSIQNKKSLRYWLRYLLDQTDSSINDIDNVQLFQLKKHITWFQTIVNTLLKGGNDLEKYNDEFYTIIFNTFHEFISTSQSVIVLAFFMATIFLVLNNASKKSDTNITHKKILLMEKCLERYIYFSKDHNRAWECVGFMIYQQTTITTANNDTLENDINLCIQYCMEQSLFLVIRAFSERKLQEVCNTPNLNKNEDCINEDYHVSEEVAAIISLIHLQPEMMADLKQIQKFVELIQFYTLLFSKYKNQKELDLWMPSLVSLSKTFTRWNAMETSDIYEHHQESSRKNHKNIKNISSSNSNDNSIFWSFFIKLLNIYIVTRLAQSDVPSFKNDKTLINSWIKELNNLKSDNNHKHLEKIISFGVAAITNNDQWTLWDLHKFIEHIMNLL